MELDFAGRTYRVGRLGPMESFHVLRRVAPLLVGAGPEILAGLTSKSDEGKVKAFLGLLLSDNGLRFAHVLASLPDAEVNYIFTHALAHTSVRESPTSWAPILSQGTDVASPMFDYITTPVLLRLVNEVIRAEILPFLAVSPLASGAEKTA